MCAHACQGALLTRARYDAPHTTAAAVHMPWRSCRQAQWRHGRGPVAQRAARSRVLAAKVCLPALKPALHLLACVTSALAEAGTSLKELLSGCRSTWCMQEYSLLCTETQDFSPHRFLVVHDS